MAGTAGRQQLPPLVAAAALAAFTGQRVRCGVL